MRTSLRLVWVLVLVSTLAAAAADTDLEQGEEALGVEEQDVLGEPAAEPLVGATLDSASEELSKKMRCPVCQGLSIADSPSEMASDMRSKVRALLGEGYSEEQVMGYFEGTYGEFVRLQPKAEGFNLLVWIAPVVALLTGLLLVAAYLRRTSNAAEEEGDDELARFEERVRREVSS